MLGASGVQIPENNLDNLKLTREEDGDFNTVDPQCLLGSEMLKGLDHKILGSLLKSIDFATLVFLRFNAPRLVFYFILHVATSCLRDPIVLGIA
ncbi:hypothetical protein Tco_1022879 [Tanacetum coccineum]